MRRLFWGALLGSVLAFLSVAAALGHGNALAVYVSLDPPAPAPGSTAQIKVETKDAYGSALPASAVRAVVYPKGQPVTRPVDLAEGPAGFRTAAIPFPAAGPAVLRLEADMPDGLWLGELSIGVGPGAIAIRDFGLELVHQEQPQTDGMGWVLTAAAVVLPSLALLFAGYLVLSLKKGKR